MGTMIKYSKSYTTTFLDDQRIGVEIVYLSNDAPNGEDYWLFNINKLRANHYTIPKYLRDWLEFELIQARLS